MNNTFFIADLKQYGLTLTAHEAVAIVQQLIRGERTAGAEPPYGPPTPENVEVRADGWVVCRSFESTAAAAEVAILLQELLSVGVPPVSGGLRYAIARALHEVDAPPFDSVEEFSDVLARYEPFDRAATVRRIHRRFVERSTEPARIMRIAPGRIERRQVPPLVTDLRRELRLVHQRFYEQRAPAHVIELPRPQLRRRFIPAVAAGVAIGFLLITAGELVWVRQQISAPADRTLPRDDDTVPGRARFHAANGSNATATSDAVPASAVAPAVRGFGPMPCAATTGRSSPSKGASRRVSAGGGAGRRAAAHPSADRKPVARARVRSSESPGVLARIRFEWDRDLFSHRP